jgi:23S rRNA G2445 N2-methylase RlmL
LAIKKWQVQVLDPACGSGTLLVASYKRKKELYVSQTQNMFSSLNHAKFIGDDINGIDIMKFAAHWASSNLLLQMPEATVDDVKIRQANSRYFD